MMENNNTKTNLKRDIQLDIYRALMMIYVPCVIHVFYWLNLVGQPWRSLALFEMPVIFFISGASMYVTKKETTFYQTIKNRSKRIIIPYYFYILVSILITLPLSFFPTLGYPEKSILSFNSIFKAIFIQDNHGITPYSFHLWFILPYLIVSCSFSIQKKWADKVNKWCYMLLLLSTCVVAVYIPGSYWGITGNIFRILRNAIFYNFFFVAGYLFYKQIPRITILKIIVISAFALFFYGLILYIGHGYISSMQGHKFPPDLLFLLFGIFIISLLGYIFGSITIPHNRIISHWNKNGYTIYLWQNISFWIYTILLYRLHASSLLVSSPINAFIAGASIFIISTISSLIIVPIESWVTNSLFHRQKSHLFKPKSTE